ncbi:hypothetical protein F5B20DRAFT_575929 [Whalleya microplaca]|nr:hypothetical protein F5B20DRAFT_575929 [Whalleya microplaca]
MASLPRSSLRRTACDRCRHSKLRCFRDEDQPKCSRCLRLELSCEIAPARRPGRPRKADSTPAAVEAPDQNINHQSLEPTHSPLTLPAGAPTPQSQDIPEARDYVQNDDLYGHVSYVSDMFNAAPVFSPPEPRSIEYGTIWGDGATPIRDPLNLHNLFEVKLDRHECLKELSQLNVDYHVQWQALKDNMDTVRFSTFVNHPPPPAGDGICLAKKLLIMSQRFQQALVNLNWVVKNEPRSIITTDVVWDNADLPVDPLINVTDSSILPELFTGNDQPDCHDDATVNDGMIDTPLVCVLVSCYVQMISLWESLFFHITRRMKGLDTERLSFSDPSKGLQMGVFYIFSGRLQGMFLAQAVQYFLVNIDRELGILPEQRRQGMQGLLSQPHHFKLLQRELGSEENKESDRPSALRESVEHVRVSALTQTGF